MTYSPHTIEYERLRCECFKLLAACFYQPDKDAFLAENTLESLCDFLGRICPQAAVFAVQMKNALLKYDNEELLVEYARLFVGPFELKAAPYGSIYLDEGRKLMGDSTLATAEIYKEEGLSLDEHFKELPDHIAAELEFMYYLAHHEVEALVSNDTENASHYLDRQAYFLTTFLGRWVNPFCEKIGQGTDNEFYQALAGCLAAFISSANNGDIIPVELKTNLTRI